MSKHVLESKWKMTCRILKTQCRTKDLEHYTTIYQKFQELICKINDKELLIQQIYEEINSEWIVNPYNQDAHFPNLLIVYITAIINTLVVSRTNKCEIRCFPIYMPAIVRILQKEYNDNFCFIDCDSMNNYTNTKEKLIEENNINCNHFLLNEIKQIQKESFCFLFNPYFAAPNYLPEYLKYIMDIINNYENVFIFSEFNFDYKEIGEVIDIAKETSIKDCSLDDLPPGDILISDRRFNKSLDLRITKTNYSFENMEQIDLELRYYQNLDLNDLMLYHARKKSPNERMVCDISHINKDIKILPFPSDINIRRIFITDNLCRYDYLRPVLMLSYLTQSEIICDKYYHFIFTNNNITRVPLNCKTLCDFAIEHPEDFDDLSQDVPFQCYPPKNQSGEKNELHIYSNLSLEESQIIDQIREKYKENEMAAYFCAYIFFTLVRNSYFWQYNYNSPVHLEVSNGTASTIVPTIRQLIQALIWKPANPINSDIDQIKESIIHDEKTINYENFNSIVLDAISAIDENCRSFIGGYKTLDLFELVDTIITKLRPIREFKDHFFTPDFDNIQYNCPGKITTKFNDDVFMLNVKKLYRFNERQMKKQFRLTYDYVHGKIEQSHQTNLAQCAVFCELIHMLNPSITTDNGTVFYKCDDQEYQAIESKISDLIGDDAIVDKFRLLLIEDIEDMTTNLNQIKKGKIVGINDCETIHNFYLYDFNLDNIDRHFDYIVLIYCQENFTVKILCQKPIQAKPFVPIISRRISNKQNKKIYKYNYKIPLVVQQAYHKEIETAFSAKYENYGWITENEEIENLNRKQLKELFDIEYEDLDNLIKVDPSILLYYAKNRTRIQGNFIYNKGEILLPHIRQLFKNRNLEHSNQNSVMSFKYKLLFPVEAEFEYPDSNNLLRNLRDLSNFRHGFDLDIKLYNTVTKINAVDLILNLYHTTETRDLLIDLINSSYSE